MNASGGTHLTMEELDLAKPPPTQIEESAGGRWALGIRMEIRRSEWLVLI